MDTQLLGVLSKIQEFALNPATPSEDLRGYIITLLGIIENEERINTSNDRLIKTYEQRVAQLEGINEKSERIQALQKEMIQRLEKVIEDNCYVHIRTD